ncbi:B-box zinc finger protein 19-like [Phoenix dactylifera]|uniref:B-box zinc finger protein 19-like n=1 Tax=Phoenix dactylifera TaxID=42345 RepID=A0A8B9ALW2_PHODC|nr:B-box zinc finger protein 19-like [Phoenix dactylifera]XP_038987731.1 B-box zinc finger protein 19-like [Phoenix dactylifera]XP_038987732.1 B-box zinc finger protein 19-like [Phoenix dactylifera]
MKGCELCERAARIYCESDQASLCWECDAKVHGANFLVARHSRCLLCRGCQVPTPWRASGARLGPTVSVCERCCLQGKRRREDVVDDDGNGEEEDEEAEEDEGDEAEGEGEGEAEEEEEEEEEGDNQVVPLSLTPPPVATSSSSEESYNGFLKRIRENADLASRDDDIPCSSSQPSYLASAPARAVAEDEATSFAGSSLGPFKDRNKAGLRGSAPSAHAQFHHHRLFRGRHPGYPPP